MMVEDSNEDEDLIDINQAHEQTENNDDQTLQLEEHGFDNSNIGGGVNTSAFKSHHPNGEEDYLETE